MERPAVGRSRTGTPLAWAASALPLSHNSWTTTNHFHLITSKFMFFFWLYFDGKWSVLHSNSIVNGLSEHLVFFQWFLSWLLHKWREGYLLPIWARKITCWCDDNWSIQSKRRQVISRSDKQLSTEFQIEVKLTLFSSAPCLKRG